MQFMEQQMTGPVEKPIIEFRTEPARYRHWRIEIEGPVAHLIMAVDPAGGLVPGYELKLNSYDLGVDIELHDAVQRLRFEHPEVGAVVLRSGREGVFCAGANIRMLGQSSHAHKVNFCKFTNETRLSIEDATAHSGQRYLSAVKGAAAGGGYELALTAAHIMLIDDRKSSVSLPELPLLAVLPGTGGLTRVTDKRQVRRDLADVFCTAEEGVRGKKAVAWRLVDEVIAPSVWDATVAQRAREAAARTDRPTDAQGVKLPWLERKIEGGSITYPHVEVRCDAGLRRAEILVAGPSLPVPGDVATAVALGADFWPLAMARALDDAILHLRTNEAELGLWMLRTRGDAALMLAYDAFLEAHQNHWLMREIRHFIKRVLKRIDVTSRSIVALIEPGSCFAGTLAELAFAADRSAMFVGDRGGEASAMLTVGPANFGAYPMGNGLTRLQTRFLGEAATIERVRASLELPLDAEAAADLGLVTFTYDQTDWDDEIRIMLEERASFSPDSLTGMEANLRFPGPETMETRIFGRLTAWQNWIFQRPNAVGPDGALKRYGSGQQAAFDRQRV
ncbi:MAG: benzoyl-CoA-dihydrodiol lyase [Acidiphilium sp. 21-60-14]|nr:MAG: benzoyl-CoA-dihydrodiol lyase [Acidiphilium sp. 21-60-14]OYV89330.1 MAG: benzoyl-CoA-dihydrodiol lyase [Acidiphilium sp. 37-60-79]